RVERLLPVAGLHHLVARAVEAEGHEVEDVGVVVRDQHELARHVAHAATSAASSGSASVNVVPTPTVLRTPRVPPCASTIDFAIETPSPVPRIVAAVEARKKR